MIDASILRAKLIENGMDQKWSGMFVKKLLDDEAAFDVDEETRRWALERGFFPGRVELYGLTERNYKDYLPDFNYFMIHPINHHFRIWVNDKLTLKYVLNSCGCESSMPEYYLYIENDGHYTYLMDAPEDIEKSDNFIIDLLQKKGLLAIKPNSGTSGGRGFAKLELKNGHILMNNELVSESSVRSYISEIPNHIVTEYAQQHSALADIWPKSECTLRVIMVKVPSQNLSEECNWSCIVSYARFGSSISGGASNLSSGGIGVGFNFNTGELNSTGIRYKKFCDEGSYICSEHPDTKTMWQGSKLPHWDYVKSMILRICRHISSLDYLGFDVIITQDGMKLCEINTHPAVDYEQIMCGPVFNKEESKIFFRNKGLFTVDRSLFYRLYSESR